MKHRIPDEDNELPVLHMGDEHKNKIKFTCPHCNTVTKFSDEQTATFEGKMYQLRKCDMCEDIVVFIFNDKYPDALPFNGVRTYALAGYNLIDYYPKTQYKPHPAIPKDIVKDYDEALRCYDNRAFKGSVIMCRRTMQAICKLKGAKKEKLHQQIDEVLPQELQEYAHEIRYWGNIGGHPDDELKDVTHDDAKSMLDFMELVFDRLFIYPHKLAASKTKRVNTR